MTHYAQIERWWEIVSSTYLMVSLQFNGLDCVSNQDNDPHQSALLNKFRQHSYWSEAIGGKQRLNNLHLIVQPYIYFCSLTPWLKVFDIPHLVVGFKRLMAIMNEFPGWMPVPKPQPKLLFSSA